MPERTSLARLAWLAWLAWVPLACRLAVGVLFVAAGAAKLLEPGSFTATLLAYQVLPVGLIRPLALTLPWLEVLLGAYLLVGLFTRMAAWAAIAFLLVFIGAIGQALLRGISLQDCGCFGSLTTQLPWLSPVLGGADAGAGDLVRDAVYVLLALVVAFGPDTPFAVDNHLGRRARSAGRADYGSTDGPTAEEAAELSG